MTKAKHYCDNINCNHNDTKGLCCLFNPENCKYRQLQKENAELKKKNLDTQDAVTMQMYTNKANKEIADRQLTKAKEIIREYSKWECEYCDYKRNPDYVTIHCSQCQKYPLHKKAEQFLSEVEK